MNEQEQENSIKKEDIQILDWTFVKENTITHNFIVANIPNYINMRIPKYKKVRMIFEIEDMTEMEREAIDSQEKLNGE